MTVLCPAIFAAGADDAGTLVLVGGGLKVDNTEILGAVREAASGLCAKAGVARPRVAVVPSSFTDLAEARAAFERKAPDKHHENPGYRAWLTNAGFSPMLIPLTQDAVFRKDNAAEDPQIAALVESCQVVFLLGGDQGCHAICLLRRDGSPSRVLEAIRGVYRRGGVVMGTSAGTHVLANPMYGWGESGPTIVRGKLEKIDLAQVTPEREVQASFPGNSVYLQGLGLLPPGVLTDTHFSIRGRLGRLVAGLRDTGMRWGLGVDENTALFLHRGQGIVRGEHGVFVVDTASATFSPAGEPFRARDVRVSLLTAGDSWNPADGAVVSSKPRVKPAGETVTASDDIFSAKRAPDDERENPYATTFVMRDLINSRATSVDARAHPAGSFVFVRFRKTGETWGGWASPSSFTVVSMHMDIDRHPMALPKAPMGSAIPTEPRPLIPSVPSQASGPAPLVTLIRGGEIYTPEYIGKQDVLIAAGKIIAIGGHIPVPAGLGAVEVIDAAGRLAVPGFIDCHVHLAGAGGEGGWKTRTPEIRLSDLTTAGVTTVVGCLGTDGFSRSSRVLLAKARSLEEEGVTAFVYTGSYQVPVHTICNSIEDDMVLIDKVIGIGEIAVSDHRSSQPTVAEIAKIAAAARIAGLLTGKAGIVNLHLGDGPRMLAYLDEIASTTEIPITQFLPTHMNRNPALFEKSISHALRGGLVDFTTSTTPQFLAEGEVKCSRALKLLLQRGVDISRITFSSDAQGSLPSFDAAGRLRGLTVAACRSLFEEVRDAVREEHIDLSTALRTITANPAAHLKLAGKGVLREGADADIVLLERDGLKIDTVMAKGRVMVRAGQATVQGTFE